LILKQSYNDRIRTKVNDAAGRMREKRAEQKRRVSCLAVKLEVLFIVVALQKAGEQENTESASEQTQAAADGEGDGRKAMDVDSEVR
jgi:hypothetical protein